jgi:hypothetical protein
MGRVGVGVKGRVILGPTPFQNTRGKVKSTHLPVNSLGVLKEPKNVIDLLNGHFPLGQVVPRLHHYAVGPTTQLPLTLITSMINIPPGVLCICRGEEDRERERERGEEEGVRVSVTRRRRKK